MIRKQWTRPSVVLLALLAAACATAPTDTGAWKVTRSSDPITGVSTCVVTVVDRFGSTAFTRVGVLYPIVENNSRLGLLVGVSTGGQIRLPAGDIVWRVDDKPFRELKMIDNPVQGGAPTVAATDPATKGMQDTIATAMRLAATATSTSTVASGDKAKEMLAEMLAGRSLIFRATQAAPKFGLPSAATNNVGQITGQGVRPIPIDASFRAGLATCGLAN